MSLDILKKNFKEYYELAEFAFKQKKFNASVTLYYKALVEICDFNLLRNFNIIGINHQDRFLLLKDNNKELYQIARKLFGFYRDTYSKTISEGIAKTIKEHIENAKRKFMEE